MEELISRYKVLPIPVRVAAVLAVAGTFVWFFFAEDVVSSSRDRVTEIKDNVDRLDAQFEKAKRDAETLLSVDELKEENQKIRDEIAQATNTLPDRYMIDQVIAMVSQSAQTHNVKLVSFQIDEERSTGGDGFNYYELPIQLEVTGSYRACGYFYNQLTQLDMMVQVRDIEMEMHMDEGPEGESQLSEIEDDEDKPEDLVVNLINSLRLYLVKSMATMIIFRAP